MEHSLECEMCGINLNERVSRCSLCLSHIYVRMVALMRLALHCGILDVSQFVLSCIPGLKVLIIHSQQLFSEQFVFIHFSINVSMTCVPYLTQKFIISLCWYWASVYRRLFFGRVVNTIWFRLVLTGCLISYVLCHNQVFFILVMKQILLLFQKA